MVKKYERRATEAHTVFDGLDLVWPATQVKRVIEEYEQPRTLDESEYMVKRFAKLFKRKQIEVQLLIMDLAERGKLEGKQHA